MMGVVEDAVIAVTRSTNNGDQRSRVGKTITNEDG